MSLRFFESEKLLVIFMKNWMDGERVSHAATRCAAMSINRHGGV